MRKMRNLFAAAHSMSAKRRPEYSRIMASWIMVSSKCVAGLSNGKRAVSASMTMMKAMKARMIGAKAAGESLATAAAMLKRLDEWAAKAKASIEKTNPPSASAETVISRLEPKP